jgi:hypothetical protein
VPLSVGLDRASDVGLPLSGLQVTLANSEDTFRLVDGLAARLPEEMRPKGEVLQERFGAKWPALAAILQEIVKSQPRKASKRDPSELLEEILAFVRGRVTDRALDDVFRRGKDAQSDNPVRAALGPLYDQLFGPAGETAINVRSAERDPRHISLRTADQQVDEPPMTIAPPRKGNRGE